MSNSNLIIVDKQPTPAELLARDIRQVIANIYNQLAAAHRKGFNTLWNSGIDPQLICNEFGDDAVRIFQIAEKNIAYLAEISQLANAPFPLQPSEYITSNVVTRNADGTVTIGGPQ